MKQMVRTMEQGEKLSILRTLLNTVKVPLLISLCYKHPSECAEITEAGRLRSLINSYKILL
jgi:hypothetical protein